MGARLEEIDSSEQEEDVATWERVINDLEEKLVEKRRDFNEVRERMSANLAKLGEEQQEGVAHENRVKEVAGKLQLCRTKIKVSRCGNKWVGVAQNIIKW